MRVFKLERGIFQFNFAAFLYAAPSRIPNAGKGAFATYGLSAGTYIPGFTVRVLPFGHKRGEYDFIPCDDPALRYVVTEDGVLYYLNDGKHGRSEEEAYVNVKMYELYPSHESGEVMFWDGDLELAPKKPELLVGDPRLVDKKAFVDWKKKAPEKKRNFPQYCMAMLGDTPTRGIMFAGTVEDIAPGEELTTDYNGDPETMPKEYDWSGL